MAPPNGLINLMKRGINSRKSSNKSKQSNNDSHDTHSDLTSDLVSDSDCSPKPRSQPTSFKSSPTSIAELNQTIASPKAKNEDQKPSKNRHHRSKSRDRHHHRHSPHRKHNRRHLSRNRCEDQEAIELFPPSTPDSSPLPNHPLTHPTLSIETLITSNCSRSKPRNSAVFSSTSSNSHSQSSFTIDPRDEERLLQHSSAMLLSDSSLASHTDVSRSTVHSSLSDLGVGPSVSKFLSLVLPTDIMKEMNEFSLSDREEADDNGMKKPNRKRHQHHRHKKPSLFRERIKLSCPAQTQKQKHLYNKIYQNTFQYATKEQQRNAEIQYIHEKLNSNWKDDNDDMGLGDDHECTFPTFVGGERSSTDVIDESMLISSTKSEDMSANAITDNHSTNSKSSAASSSYFIDDLEDHRHVELDIHMRNIYAIGFRYLQEGELEMATKIFRNVTQDHIEHYGNGHPIVGLALRNLSVIYIWEGDYKRAKKFILRALDCQRNILSTLEDEKSKEKMNYYSTLMDVVNTLYELGIIQCALMHHTASLASLREALQLTCKVYGYDHPHAAKILNCIGCVHFDQEQYIPAQTTFKKALDILRGRSGESSSKNAVGKGLLNVAAILGNMAMCYWKKRQWDDSIATLEEVLMVQESVLGEDHDTIFCTISNLEWIGLLRRRNQEVAENISTIPEMRHNKSKHIPGKRQFPIQGSVRPSRAAFLFGEADGLPITKTNDSIDCIDYISLGPLQYEITPVQRIKNTIITGFYGELFSEFKLGSFLERRDDEEGRDQVTVDREIKNITIKKRIRSSVPIDVDGQKVVNAELYLKEIHDEIFLHLTEGDVSDALDLFQCVLRSHKEKFGDDHHLVGQVLHNIGTVYLFAEEYKMALPMFKQALKIRAEALNPDHPDVTASLIKTGLALFALSEYDSALTTFSEALRVRRKKFGYSHPLVAQILNNIGAVHYELGGLLSALKAFEEALEVQKAELEKDHDNSIIVRGVAGTLGNIGFIHAKRKDYAEAIVVLEEALGLYRQVLDPEDSTLRVTLGNLAYVLTYANSSIVSHEAEKMINVYKDMLEC